MSNYTDLFITYGMLNTAFAPEDFNIRIFQSHKSVELVYVVSGHFEMDYYDKKERIKTIHLLSNQFLLIMPNIKHRQRVLEKTRFYVFEVDIAHALTLPQWLKNSQTVKSCEPVAKFVNSLDDIVILNDSGHMLRSAFQKVLSLFYAKHKQNVSPFLNLECEVALKNLLLECSKAFYSDYTVLKYNKYVTYALQVIREQYHKNIHIADIARELGISYCHLCNVFRREFGITIKQHLMNTRMNKAMELLKISGYNIKTVALSSGYENLRSFELAFTKATSKTPTQYRKELAKNGYVFWTDHASNSVGEDSTMTLDSFQIANK